MAKKIKGTCYFECGEDAIGTIDSGTLSEGPFASVAICGNTGCVLEARSFLYKRTQIEAGELVTFKEWRRRSGRAS